MDIKIIKAKTFKNKPDDSKLGFGSIFTDYMFNMDYSPDKGWYNPRIEPYGSIAMDPATMVLHYGQAVFEGLKAYKTSSGDIRLFRPRKNFQRMNASSHLLCIPPIDEEFVLDCLKELIKLEKNWIPSAEGTSLYIRPTIISTDPFLGVRVSNTYRFFIILSPVGAYYKEGFNPVKIWVSKNHVRAVRGGLGEAKTPANYAASLFAAEKAHHEGYSQVLWLDGINQCYIEEVGSMNIFFIINGELVTPKLSGSILPGITRDSVITLAKDWGIVCNERQIGIDEVIEAQKQGQLTEAFGSGTAAVISPVGIMRYEGKEYTINHEKVGNLTRKFYDSLTQIQYGKSNDPFGWIEFVDKA